MAIGAVRDNPCSNTTRGAHEPSPHVPTLALIDPAVSDIFSVIDTNGDHHVCFKPYPNGDHHGHGGNLVDDKAAPHT